MLFITLYTRIPDISDILRILRSSLTFFQAKYNEIEDMRCISGNFLPVILHFTLPCIRPDDYMKEQRPGSDWQLGQLGCPSVSPPDARQSVASSQK